MEKLNMNDMIQPKQNESDNDRSTNDIISLMAVNDLLSPSRIKTNSRIKYNQVSQLSKLYLYADVFGIDFIESMANNILELQISINGLGRKELVELVSRVNDDSENDDIKQMKKQIFR